MATATKINQAYSNMHCFDLPAGFYRTIQCMHVFPDGTCHGDGDTIRRRFVAGDGASSPIPPSTRDRLYGTSPSPSSATPIVRPWPLLSNRSSENWTDDRTRRRRRRRRSYVRTAGRRHRHSEWSTKKRKNSTDARAFIDASSRAIEQQAAGRQPLEDQIESHPPVEWVAGSNRDAGHVFSPYVRVWCGPCQSVIQSVVLTTVVSCF